MEHIKAFCFLICARGAEVELVKLVGVVELLDELRRFEKLSKLTPLYLESKTVAGGALDKLHI